MTKRKSPDPTGSPTHLPLLAQSCAHQPPKSPVRILALDLGSDTGWCSTSTHTREIGTIHLSRTATHGARYSFFRGALQQLIAATDPQLVAYENVRAHSSSDAAHMYGALLGIVQSVCHEAHRDLIGLEVSTIKKHATGRGNADKNAMIAAAEARGWQVSDHNQADACWIHDLAQKITKEKPCQPQNPSCPPGTPAPHTGESASIGCSGKPRRPGARKKRSSKLPTESESATSAP